MRHDPLAQVGSALADGSIARFCQRSEAGRLTAAEAHAGHSGRRLWVRRLLVKVW